MKQVSNDKKMEVCRKHSAILYIINLFGSNVMYTTHIREYMKYFYNINPTETMKNIRELEKNQIVEVQKKCHCYYIRLKKFALRYLEFARTKVLPPAQSKGGYEFTEKLLRKSLFKNNFLIKYKIKKFDRSKEGIKSFAQYVQHETTLFTKDKRVPEVFKRYPTNNFLLAEIKNLTAIEKQQYERLTSKSSANKVTKAQLFNANNMQGNNVYITILNAEQVEISIIDSSVNYAPAKLKKMIKETYDYLNFIIGITSHSVTINFYCTGSNAVGSFDYEVKKELYYNKEKTELNPRPYDNFLSTIDMAGKVHLNIYSLDIDIITGNEIF